MARSQPQQLRQYEDPNTSAKKNVPISEETLINAVFTSIDFHDKSLDILLKTYLIITPDMFTNSMHSLAWTALTKLYNKHGIDGATNIPAISQTMEKIGKLPTGEAEFYCAQRMQSIPISLQQAELHVTAILDCAKHNAAIDAAQQYANRIMIHGPDQAASWMSARMNEIAMWTLNGPSQRDYITGTEVIPEKITWLWPGHIPLGKITIVDGHGGKGKTLIFGADIPARLTRGRPMPDGSPVEATNVIYIGAEDGIADTIIPRFIAANGDLNKFIIVKLTDDNGDDRMVNLETDLHRIEHIIEVTHAQYVVIDPILAYLGKADSYKEQDVRRILTPYAKLAERTHTAFILIRHPTKPGLNKSAAYAGAGSVAFTNLARCVMIVGDDPENEQMRILAISKINIAVDAPSLRYSIQVSDQYPDIPVIVWHGITDSTADDVFAANKNDIKNLGQLKKDIILYMQNQPDPVTPKMITTACDNATSGNIRITLRRMVDDDIIEQCSYGKYICKQSHES